MMDILKVDVLAISTMSKLPTFECDAGCCVNLEGLRRHDHQRHHLILVPRLLTRAI